MQPRLRVEHGTSEKEHAFLLHDALSTHEMGQLKPDVLVLDGNDAVAVLDAKYKRLASSLERPSGVDRGDLNQIATYAMRFAPSAVAALVYPRPPAEDESTPSPAEALGPWHDERHCYVFKSLPVGVADARAALATMIEAVPE